MASTRYSLSFDDRVYPLLALQKAAYRYITAFACDFSLEGNQIKCDLVFNIELSEVSREKYIQEFKKEILDQHLRLTIKNETENIRNLILGVAFSKTGLHSGE